MNFQRKIFQILVQLNNDNTHNLVEHFALNCQPKEWDRALYLNGTPLPLPFYLLPFPPFPSTL